MSPSASLVAYHGDPAAKEAALAKIQAHQQADRIIQGTYWGECDGTMKGCAVGCLLEEPNGGHERYETEFGIPVQLAWLEDGIFEALDPDAARGWPHRFMEAVPVGADLSQVWARFAVWLMVDDTHGLVNVAGEPDIQDVCRKVADGYQRRADGNPLTQTEEQAITDAAWAAWAARDEWAAWAAWAARAARDARAARAARAEWAALVTASADKLVELLAGAPILDVERTAS